MQTTSRRPKGRPLEISIFQTSKPRPSGIKAQLLLVLTTFVACLFVAMIWVEETPSHQDAVAQKKPG